MSDKKDPRKVAEELDKKLGRRGKKEDINDSHYYGKGGLPSL